MKQELYAMRQELETHSIQSWEDVVLTLERRQDRHMWTPVFSKPSAG
jgi:hypothetical protein